MKNSFQSVKEKLLVRYASENPKDSETKSTDINILLNRVKLDKKRESRKKLLFSAATSAGILIFGILVF